MEKLLTKKSKIMQSIEVHAKKRSIHAKKMDARRSTYLKQFEAEKANEAKTRPETKKVQQEITKQNSSRSQHVNDYDEDEVTIAEPAKLNRNESIVSVVSVVSAVSAPLDVRDDNDDDAAISNWCLCSPKGGVTPSNDQNGSKEVDV